MSAEEFISESQDYSPNPSLVYGKGDFVGQGETTRKTTHDHILVVFKTCQLENSRQAKMWQFERWHKYKTVQIM